MSKIKCLLATAMCIWAYSSHAKDTPVLSQLPAGWSILEQKEGDINGDKKNDYAIILQKNDVSLREKRDDGYVLDFNPRRLLVYLSSKDGYQKALETKDSLLPTQNSREIFDREDPFSARDSLSIEKGQISLTLEHLVGGGAWNSGGWTYKIRYKDNKFSIIGRESSFFNSVTGDLIFESINYLTNKRKIREDINVDQSERRNPKEFWEKLTPKEIPKTLDLSELTELFHE